MQNGNERQESTSQSDFSQRQNLERFVAGNKGHHSGHVEGFAQERIEGLERAGFSIVEREDQLPDEVRPESGEAVRGVYHKGKTYLYP